jgi:hypothetical protein
VEDYDKEEPKLVEQRTKKKTSTYLVTDMDDNELGKWKPAKSAEACTVQVDLRDAKEDTEKFEKEDCWEYIGEGNTATGLPPSPDRLDNLEGIHTLQRGQSYQPGCSSANVSVLSTRGWLGHPSGPRVNLRLDSCADVTLVAASFIQKMKNPLKLQQGLWMRLYQLMDKDTRITGYVNLSIFMMTTTSKVIQMEAEAYVVPDMTMDILLGKDFHLNYSITMERLHPCSTTITFANQNTVVEAKSVQRLRDAQRIKRLGMNIQSFVKAALHWRECNAKQQAKAKEHPWAVRAAMDHVVPACTIVRLPVTGKFGKDPSKNWFIKRGFAEKDPTALLATDPLFFSSLSPIVSAFNGAYAERQIKKGNLLGYFVDPEDYFDIPDSPEAAQVMLDHATKTADFIQARMDAKEEEKREDAKVRDTEKEKETLQEVSVMN